MGAQQLRDPLKSPANARHLIVLFRGHSTLVHLDRPHIGSQRVERKRSLSRWLDLRLLLRNILEPARCVDVRLKRHMRQWLNLDGFSLG